MCKIRLQCEAAVVVAVVVTINSCKNWKNSTSFIYYLLKLSEKNVGKDLLK